VGIDNSKSINPLLLSVLIFLTNVFDKCIVLCLSYSIFFDKFIGLKINVSIILNKSLPKDFLCDVFNVHRIPYDYCFIDIMGLNFFSDRFSIKSMFLKVKRRYIHQNRFALLISSLLLSLAPFL
jgi:hypothetical protein